jgi:hypothetical protein
LVRQNLTEAIVTERGKAMAKRLFLGVVAALFVCALGSSAMGAADPNALYAPSIDHFKCYKVKDLSVPAMVDVPSTELVDALVADPNMIVKKKMKWACAPVDKNGEGIINAAEWLCGYKLKTKQKFAKPLPQKVLTNQFQLPAVVEIKKADFLLAPCADPNALP